MTGRSFTVDRIEAPSEVEVASPASAGYELQVQVSFRPRERPGWREGKIKFFVSGLKRKEIVVPFKAMVDGVVDTEPNFLNFGSVEPGQTKRLTFRVVNRSGEQMRLQLKSAPKFVRVEPADKAGSEWSVELKVPANTLPSQVLSGKIVFTTRVPVQPVLEVPFFAAVETQNKRSERRGEGYEEGR